MATYDALAQHIDGGAFLAITKRVIMPRKRPTVDLLQQVRKASRPSVGPPVSAAVTEQSTNFMESSSSTAATASTAHGLSQQLEAVRLELVSIRQLLAEAIGAAATTELTNAEMRQLLCLHILPHFPKSTIIKMSDQHAAIFRLAM